MMASAKCKESTPKNGNPELGCSPERAVIGQTEARLKPAPIEVQILGLLVAFWEI